MSERIDLTGNKYGKLTVIEMLYGYKVKETSTPKTYVKCVCDCGNIVIRDAWAIKNPNVRHSCGCDRKEIIQSWKSADVTGQKFGRLTVLKVNWEKTSVTVICQCECGDIKEYYKADVVKGHTQSCGCLQKERAREATTKDWTGFVTSAGVEFIRQYKLNNKNQWLWECKCPYCGDSFYELPIRVINGHTSCGCHSGSYRERFIEALLKENNVKYKREFSFKDLLSKRNYRLRFDFALFNDDGLLNCLIEYDGEQHFKEVSCFPDSLEKRQENDALKNEYCAKNNINLIRIPYYKKDEEIKEIILNICNP